MSAGKVSGKVLARPDDLNLEFFQRIVQTGQMHVQQCVDCKQYSHPPRYYCSACYSGRWEFVRVSGDGHVYSHTLSHFTAEAAWRDELPYSTIVVELNEGPRIVGAARGMPPESIRIGQRVRVVPEARTDDFAFFTVVLTEPAAADV